MNHTIGGPNLSPCPYRTVSVPWNRQRTTQYFKGRELDIYLHFQNELHVCYLIKTVAKEQYGIEISRWEVRDLIKKWKTFGSIQDQGIITKNCSSLMKACWQFI